MKPYLYTETAFHHEGDFDFLIKLIDGSAQAGADGIKFQVLIDFNELISKINPSYTKLKDHVFTASQWRELFQHALSKKLDLIIMPLDLGAVRTSLDFASSVKFLEIHSVSFYDQKLKKAIKESGINTSLGVGGRTADELRQDIRYFGSQLTAFVAGFQSYPSQIQDIKIRRIQEMRRLFPDMTIGYADHSAFDNPWAIRSNEVAYLLGATLFEKHFTLNEGEKRVDFESAVNADKIRSIRKNLDELSLAVHGYDDPFAMSPAELTYRARQKVAVAARHLTEGTNLSKDDLKLKMIGNPGGMAELSGLIGKKLKKNIDTDELIRLEDVAD